MFGKCLSLIILTVSCLHEVFQAGRQIKPGTRLPAAILLTEPCHALIQACWVSDTMSCASALCCIDLAVGGW